MSTTVNKHQCETSQDKCCSQDSQRGSVRLRPRVDILEEKHRFLMLVDLPGVSKDNLDVSLEKDELSLQGVAKHELPEGYQLVSGNPADRIYARSFRISDEVDRDGIEVELKDGVACFTLPKSVKAQKVKLTVK